MDTNREETMKNKFELLMSVKETRFFSKDLTPHSAACAGTYQRVVPALAYILLTL